MSEAKSLAEVIEFTEQRFHAVAPKYLNYEAEKGFAIQLLKNNSYLHQAAKENPASLQQAITNIAAIGLSLNPAEKLAYLITRNVKTKLPNGQDKWETRVFLEPSYMGLIRLATDSGSIEWAQAKCVYDKDDFMDNGPGEKPTHKYNAFKDRGEFVGVYCTAKTKHGDFLTTTMDKDQVLSIRDRSEAWKNKMKREAKGQKASGGPWETDFEEMAKKTVVRNAFKTWPRTDERRMSMLAEAVNISNENEGFEPIITAPAHGKYTADQKAYFDQLIEQGDSLGMFCFLEQFGHDPSHPNAAVMTSLFHSFPKGQKGKYRDIVADLRDSGEKTFNSIVASAKAAIFNEDDIELKRIVDEDLPNDGMLLLEDALSNEEITYFKTVTHTAA